MFIIAQLELCLSSFDDFFKRIRSTNFDFVFVKNDIDKVKSWEIEKLVDKRNSARDVEYLMRWKSWDEAHDVWRRVSELDNAINLMNDYEREYKISSSTSSSSEIAMLFEDRQSNQSKILISRIVISSINSSNIFSSIALISRHSTFVTSSSMSSSIDDARRSLRLLRRKLLDKKWLLSIASILDAQLFYHHHRHSLSWFHHHRWVLSRLHSLTRMIKEWKSA